MFIQCLSSNLSYSKLSLGCGHHHSAQHPSIHHIDSLSLKLSAEEEVLDCSIAGPTGLIVGAVTSIHVHSLCSRE